MTRKHIKILSSLGVLLTLGGVLVGCSNTTETETTSQLEQTMETSFSFQDDLVFIMGDNAAINLDLEKSSQDVSEKYNTLSTALKGVDLNNIGMASTSTINMLSEINFKPKAATESKSLKPDILEKFYKLGEVGIEDGIISLGSPLNPDIETITQSGVEMILLSDALPPTKWETAVTELGVKVQRLNQSYYTDMFVILQALKDTMQIDETILNEKMLAMKEDLEVIEHLRKDQQQTKEVAVLQVFGETTYINGEKSVLGQVVGQLGLENVFAEATSSELNVEEMLMRNPEYLIVYAEGLTRTQLIEAFEKTFLSEENALSSLQAMQEGKYIFLGDDNFDFIGSIDFNVTKLMRQIIEGIYGVD